MNTRKDIELENVLDEEIYFTELPEEDKQLFCRYIRKTKLFGIFSLDSICTIPYNVTCSKFLRGGLIMKLTYTEPMIEIKRYEISDVISAASGNNGGTTEATAFDSIDDIVNDADLSTTPDEPVEEESAEPVMDEPVAESVDSFLSE